MYFYYHLHTCISVSEFVASQNGSQKNKVANTSSVKSPTVKSPTSPSKPSAEKLSSNFPDVVHCHSVGTESDIFQQTPSDNPGYRTPVTDGTEKLQAQLFANHDHNTGTQDFRSPGSKIKEYIVKLSTDTATTFGSTIENFIQCTLDSQEKNPQHVMRNVRQFMTGIKNYLVKHGEGKLEDLIERERNKLKVNEILNIDSILEQSLHICVLKPVKHHLYKLFVETYSENGSLQQLSENIRYARTKSSKEMGVKAGLQVPSGEDMERIKKDLDMMQRSFSPLRKLEYLLHATSTIYRCVQGKVTQLPSRGPSSLGADDFLPMLIYVIVHCGMISAEVEADFMWGLLQPSLLTGEGGYYLTTLSSAVLVLKNFAATHVPKATTIEVTRHYC